jgi:hypothetical protein
VDILWHHRLRRTLLLLVKVSAKWLAANNILIGFAVNAIGC